jgi:hypothetical protein
VKVPMPFDIDPTLDLQHLIPMNAHRILEIGCGDGS